jgi:hypothetical protein
MPGGGGLVMTNRMANVSSRERPQPEARQCLLDCIKNPLKVNRGCAAAPPCGSLAPAANVAACPRAITEFW